MLKHNFHRLILKLFGPQYSCVNKSTKDNRSRLIKTHNCSKVYAFCENNFGNKIETHFKRKYAYAVVKIKMG